MREPSTSPHHARVALRHPLRRCLGAGRALISAALFAAGVLAVADGARAQTTPLTVSLANAIPFGGSAAAIPVGQQTTLIVVTNPTPTAVANVQVVFRAALAPAAIQLARDPSAPVGVVDPGTGFWYHTIAQIPASGSATFTVTWLQPCPGKWPVAVRVADRVEKHFDNFVGTANPSCPADEVQSNQPAAYYALPWPPSLNPAVSTSTTAAPTSAPTSTLPGASTVAPSSSTTVAGNAPTTSTTPTTNTTPGATTVAGASTTTSPGATTSTLPGPTTSRPPTTLTPPPSSAPGLTTTTLFGVTPGSSAPAPSTTVRRTGPTTTVVILCKTIGGRRYCAPQSSVYKPGQKKAVEVKPGTKKAKTKTKKK